MDIEARCGRGLVLPDFRWRSDRPTQGWKSRRHSGSAVRRARVLAVGPPLDPERQRWSSQPASEGEFPEVRPIYPPDGARLRACGRPPSTPGPEPKRRRKAHRLDELGPGAPGRAVRQQSPPGPSRLAPRLDRTALDLNCHCSGCGEFSMALETRGNRDSRPANSGISTAPRAP